MEPLAAIAAVCLLVWTAALLLRGGPLAGCLLFLALATCFGYDFFNFNAGVNLTIDRVFWVVVMLLALVWRQRGWSAPKPLSAADKLALALVGYLAVRTLFTDPHGTGMMPWVNLVLWYVMPLGLYFDRAELAVRPPAKHSRAALLYVLWPLSGGDGDRRAVRGLFPGLSSLYHRLDERQDRRIRRPRPRATACTRSSRAFNWRPASARR